MVILTISALSPCLAVLSSKGGRVGSLQSMSTDDPQHVASLYFAFSPMIWPTYPTPRALLVLPGIMDFEKLMGVGFSPWDCGGASRRWGACRVNKNPTQTQVLRLPVCLVLALREEGEPKECLCISIKGDRLHPARALLPVLPALPAVYGSFDINLGPVLADFSNSN